MRRRRPSLHAVDVRAFLGAQSVGDAVEQGDVVEYWKSAPYLFNFMDNYALKKAFSGRAGKRQMVRLVRQFPKHFSILTCARAYKPIEPANPRLRELLSETVDRGMWRLLWMPPALDYYALEGPFAAPELRGVTKRLVFSAWHMVPRAVASLLSFEAERRMMRAAQPHAGPLTQDDWKKQRGLFALFGISDDRRTGLPLLLLGLSLSHIRPGLRSARAGAKRQTDGFGGARAVFIIRIKTALEKLEIAQEATTSTDDRWYWLAPMLLDFAEFPDSGAGMVGPRGSGADMGRRGIGRGRRRLVEPCRAREEDARFHSQR